MAARQDQRSAQAQAYRRWYGMAAWKSRRAAQLATHPLCEMCEAQGHVAAATIADHKIPHRGDRNLFFNGELTSLCAPHHDAAKQREERLGFSPAIDTAGWPLDQNHPFNATRRIGTG